MPEAAPRMFQEYRGRNYPVIAERAVLTLEQLYVSAVIRVGIVSGWPCAVIVLIITVPFPLTRARASMQRRFPPPGRPIIPVGPRA